MSEKSNFEQNMTELQDVVKQLEEGALPLNEAVERFQQGADIVKKCQKELQEAELKVEKITNAAGEE